MAPLAGSSHSFQKLKLDTTASHKPVKSTFASISRNDQHAPPQQRQPQQAEPHNGPDSSLLSASDFIGSNYFAASHNSVSSHRGDQNGEAKLDDIETRFRNRTTSISFDNAVTLDSGNRLSVEEPLPKFSSSRAASDDEDDARSSDQDYIEIPAKERRHPMHRLYGQSPFAVLPRTASNYVKDAPFHDQDHVASLTSDATASPVMDEVRTPPETPSEYMLSPIPATSPIEFPPFGMPRRQPPARTRSYRSEMDGEANGSLRKTSRRSSTRSGRSLSSMSPAASFLSRYKVTDAPLKPSEPDDEGQGIGYQNEYIIGKQIGYGGFSVVKEVSTIENGVRVVHAVKIVRKQLKNKSEVDNEQIQTQFDHEVGIWRFLRHPYILPLLCVYNTDFATFCITKLNKGGTLHDLIRDIRRKNLKGLPTHLAKRYTCQLASALRYLHNDVLVVHRDVKLENCLLDMTVPNAEKDGGDVLLCDFGMADFFVSDQRDGPEPHSTGDNQNIGPADTSTSIQGSLQYAAPELFGATGSVFSPAADIWAFGVVVYALLTARLPFNEGLDAKTIVRIQKGEWDAEAVRQAEALQDGGVEEAMELLTGCLTVDPDKRWTINDVLSCSWLAGCSHIYEDVTRSWLAGS
ncbi:kinase-like protein [Aaosphaeria arxii CBS 175.79]|uniref:Kinase-like protein n=1 Tax=Aaosphaeria arxii CBS 175.79 TaxID=1450172 RepID=A0A6A5XF86_9PLEO|nr:kinase-like protein [Aaosphaeria arxii CBS 175.79]KAF2011521.1 kinase-like protein [Aaosphaeria arxii CBS 175.79]